LGGIFYRVLPQPATHAFNTYCFWFQKSAHDNVYARVTYAASEKGVAKHMGKSAKAFRMQGLKAAKVERQTKPKPKVQQQDISKAQRQGKGPATVVKSPAALKQKSKA